MSDSEVVILGAGIGGLTAAVALQALGITVSVHEATLPGTALGGGLMLAHNGMQVMQRLGLRDAVERAGYSIRRFLLSDSRLSPLRDISFASLDAQYGLGHIAIQRARLRQTLLDALPAGTVHYGKRCEAVENFTDAAVVRFVDGTSVRTSVLIAADGLHSAARRSLVPECKPRFCGQAAWTGIRRGPIVPELSETVEAWGPGGSRMVVTPVAPDETYWVAITDAAPGAGPAFDQVQAHLDAHYAPILAALPRNTDPAGTYQWHFYDVPSLGPWHCGRTAFLGDAAHATTPNLGQGGNQALEDALLLANLLAQPAVDAPRAFAVYYASRRRKVRQVIDASRRWGQVSHWRNPWLCAVRNALLRALPERVSLHLQAQLAQVHALSASHAIQ